MRFVFHRRTSIELNTRAHVSAVHCFSSELLFVFELYQVKRTQKRSFFFFYWILFMCFQQFPVSQKTGCIEEFGHVVRTIFWCLSFFRDNNKGPLFSFGCVVEVQRWCASSSRKWQGFFFSPFSVSTKAVSDLVGQNRGSTTYVCSRQHAYFFPIL